MSNGKFDMQLIVPTKLVGTIIELLEGEGVIVSMVPNNDKTKRGKNQRYADGKRNKGIAAPEAVLAILNESKVALTVPQIGKLMASKHNFAESSASSTVSRLRKEKKIKCVDGKYHVAS